MAFADETLLEKSKCVLYYFLIKIFDFNQEIV